MKKNVKWVGFGDSDDDEQKLDPESPEAAHIALMEEDGFTMTKIGDNNIESKKIVSGF